MKRSTLCNLLILASLIACDSKPPERISLGKASGADSDTYSGNADGNSGDSTANNGNDNNTADGSTASGTTASTTTNGAGTVATNGTGTTSGTTDANGSSTNNGNQTTTTTKSPEEMQKDANLLMLASKQVRTDITVTEAQGWGTSTNKYLEFYVAVDAQGRAIVPSGVDTQQIRTSTDDKQDSNFKDNQNKDVNTLHSFIKVCNKSSKQIELHAQGSVPFEHGNEAINPNACAKFLVNKADAIKVGDSYDHIIGNHPENFIYMKMIKIKPDGSQDSQMTSSMSNNGNSNTSTVNYASVKSIFDSNCVGCHGNKGGVTLSSYASIKSSLDKVKSAVDGKAMPPGGGLPDDQIKSLDAWFAKGAPEN